ncbi:NADPH:adrenodoxin oxidoreductase, mitochondrial-like isoform X1 [Penaeus japonicus]|uniref:NADPH:adrenodoxin oxidoreductase, mitochondrial-like isoform X1 n=1 Tax=Penaeus japonicus TaxID=27405 RepID=UPI001C712960|nr:NADPH:adrenodoxin oxidoreductase, mitochondrial-like isoform X1 [Penaeus japonicus]
MTLRSWQMVTIVPIVWSHHDTASSIASTDALLCEFPDMLLRSGFSRLAACRLSTTAANTAHVPKVCIVGSGPAGFYAAQQIIKSHETAEVDIYEKLPVPFGLVRFGVAPDHPEVKNCINTFTQTASKNRVTFLGNVDIGSDVTFSQLRQAYHAIILAYGNAKDRTMNIPGEELSGVLSARQFVGWYNGLPEDADLNVNLDVESVAIIGQGNVALDVARILLTPMDMLRKTDIPESVLDCLDKSRVKYVTLIGRRGPQNVAFTIKELREMVNLPGCRPSLIAGDYQHLRDLVPSLPRPRKRLLELLAKTALDTPAPALASAWAAAQKEWRLRFLLSPVEVLAGTDGQTVSGLKLAHNRLQGDGENQRAVQTEETETLECGLVLRSIGYKGIPIDPSLPFDQRTGTIANDNGRVKGENGIYVSGWIGTGPVGVILSTMTSGFTSGKMLVADLNSGQIDGTSARGGKEEILEGLTKKGLRPVTFTDWNRLDKFEVEAGTKLGKPREKVTNVQKMLDITYD